MDKKLLKIGIIGTGHVGGTTAFALALQGLVSEMVLIDIIEEKAYTEMLDLRDCMQNLPYVINFSTNNYKELIDADIVVFAAGPAEKEIMKDRLDECAAAARIVDNVAPMLVSSGFSGVVVSVTNPCDVIAHYLQTKTQFPCERVVGSGTILDTNRLKNVTGNESVFVIGEHGESQVAVGANEKDATCAKESAWRIFKTRGFTNYGIATSVTKIIKAIRDDTGEKLLISTYDKEADAYYSRFATIGKKGVITTQMPDIDENAKADLSLSIATIKKHYKKLIV